MSVRLFALNWAGMTTSFGDSSARVCQGVEVVGIPGADGIEGLGAEREVDAADFGRRRAGQGNDVELVGIAAAAETNAAQCLARHGHVACLERQDRLHRVEHDAVAALQVLGRDGL